MAVKKTWLFGLVIIAILFSSWIYFQWTHSPISDRSLVSILNSPYFQWNIVAIVLALFNRIIQLGSLLGLPISGIIGAGYAFGLIYLGITRRKYWQWFSAMVFLGLIGLSFIAVPISPHYYTYLFPLFFLSLGAMLKLGLDMLPYKNWLFIGLLGAYGYLQWPLYNFHRPLDWQIKDYRQVAADISQDVDNQRFNLFEINKYGQHVTLSYRYFLEDDETNISPILDFNNLDRLYVISNSPLVVHEDGTLPIEGVAQGQIPSKLTHQWQYPAGYTVYRLDSLVTD